MSKETIKHLILFAFVFSTAFVFSGCEADTVLPAEGTYVQRYIMEITEANLTGQGGKVDMPSLSVSVPGGDQNRMPMVLVYGDKRRDNEWQRLEVSAYKFYEGTIEIDPNVGQSSYYRIVVLK